MRPTDPVRIRLFAQVRDVAGVDTLTLTVADASTPAQLRARLVERFPELAPLLDRCAVAVNLKYATDQHPICAGDEVAIIPPVAGG